MKAPIKERIVVLRYKRLADEVYRGVCDAFVAFLREELADESFTEEKMNLPSVTIPGPTIGDVDPDWKQLKVSVDRPSRFWNSNRTKCVQFFKNVLTVNLIEKDEVCKGSHELLFSFFERLLPFFAEYGKTFEIIKAGIDYQNVLEGEQVSDFVIRGGATLEVEKIFRNDIVGCAIDGAVTLAPFRRQTIYGPNSENASPFPATLVVSINVPDRDSSGWQVYVLLSAAGVFPGFDKGNVMGFLQAMHSAVYKGFGATFSDVIVARAEVRK